MRLLRLIKISYFTEFLVHFYSTMPLKQIFPIATWLPQYKWSLAISDGIAGVTLASFVLPESMAYAALAGVPAESGIYCCVAGCLFFALLTQSKQTAVGPTSAMSLMVGGTVAVLSGGDPVRWAAIASLTALTIFVLCVIAWLIRLSSLVNFIGENIQLGFKAGAACSIAITQLPWLFGIDGGGSNFFERTVAILRQLPETEPLVLGVGLIALMILIVGYRVFPGRPIALLVVAAGVAAVYFFEDDLRNLPLVGDIPQGLPHLGRPSLRFADVDGILGLAFGCFLMGYIETVSAARTFAEKNGYEVSPHQELLALGAANFASSFAGGYPVAGGMSQSIVNDKAGARTPMALIVCSGALCVLLLFFTGFLSKLPQVILTVVVLEAVSGLVKWKELLKLYRLSKSEFIIAMSAVAGVIAFGILKGVLISAVLSIIYVIVRSSSPSVVLLGRVPGTTQYTDMSRHPDNEKIPGCLIFRIESSLFYYNQQYVYARMMDEVDRNSDVKAVIVDLSATPSVDVAASDMLIKFHNKLQERDIRLHIVNALAEVRDLLRKQGMEQAIGHISRRVTVDNVVNEFQMK